jgi:proton-coupled amino acid transporter
LRSLNQNQNLPLMSADKKQRNSNTRVYYIIENVFRSLVIIFTFSLAIVVPRIDLFIALIGAIASSTLAIIVPIVLDHVIFWPIENHSLVKVVKNSIILVFGVYIFFAGTYTSLSDIFDYLKE